jgi:hypothetical protein
MKIDSLKDLEQLVKLCRKTGIDAIKIDNIEFTLGTAPKTHTRQPSVANDFPEANIRIPQYNPLATPGTTQSVSQYGQTAQNVSQYVQDTIKTDGLTDEQLMFYSATGELNNE